MSARAFAVDVARACEARKASDIVVLQVSKVTFIADFFVICSVQSERQSRAVAEEAATLRRPLGREGDREGAWSVVDFGDVVLHVMTADARAFYQIEAAWPDGTKVAWEKSRKAAAKR